MAWDNTLPADTTKIRNLGTVIRPNWIAIEQAQSSLLPYAINFIDRTASVTPIDPVAIAGALVAFCKQDDDGDQKLYTIDPNSTIAQIFAGTFTDHGGTQYTLDTGLGVVFKFGAGTASPSGTTNTFPSAFGTAANGVLITIRNAGQQGSAVTGPSISNFVAYSESGTQTCYYFAWGS